MAKPLQGIRVLDLVFYQDHIVRCYWQIWVLKLLR